MQSLDIVTDNNPRVLNLIEQTVGIPEGLFKEASSELSGVYADQEKKLHPIGTPEEIWASAAYCIATEKEQYIPIIKKAAASFGVENLVQDLESNFSNNIKKASASKQLVKYAFSYEEDDGSIRSFFPIDTPERIKTSAASLIDNKHKLPLPAFRKVAQVIVAEAEAAGVDEYITPSIFVYGESRIPDYDNLIKHANARAASDSPEVSKFYKWASDKFASIRNQMDPADVDPILDQMFEVDKIDQASYDSGDPYQVAYTNAPSVKSAAASADRHVLLCDVTIPREDFSRADQQALSDILGSRIGGIYKKAASEFSGIKASIILSELDHREQKNLLKFLADTIPHED